MKEALMLAIVKMGLVAGEMMLGNAVTVSETVAGVGDRGEGAGGRRAVKSGAGSVGASCKVNA